jgi:hypothetical protein
MSEAANSGDHASAQIFPFLFREPDLLVADVSLGIHSKNERPDSAG